MADTVTGNAKVQLQFTQTPANPVFSQSIPIALPDALAFAAKFGVTADQINRVYANQFTFAASTGQTLDLNALADVLGASFSFARVKLFAIRVNSTTDGASLTLAPDGTNGWAALFAGDLVVLASTSSNGAFFVVAAPNTTGYVVDATHKVIDLTPSAHAFTVDVLIAGCDS